MNGHASRYYSMNGHASRYITRNMSVDNGKDDAAN